MISVSILQEIIISMEYTFIYKSKWISARTVKPILS